MSENQNKISVVLCTYNGALFIAEQLNSILNQSFPIHEIIIVDDCSTDNTVAVLEEFAQLNPLISIYKNEKNLGYNKNFEKGCRIVTGDIIAISDQDDVWHIDKLKTLMAHWKDNSILTYADSVTFTDRVPTETTLNKLSRRIYGHDPRPLVLFNTISGHAILFKKELLQLALPFPETIFYDWWLAMVAKCNGGVSYVPQVLVYQRKHLNNVTIAECGSAKDGIKHNKIILSKQLKDFHTLPNLRKQDKLFFETFAHLWYQKGEGFSMRLFLFMVKNRHYMFAYKARKFPFFSHVKNSYRYSVN